MTKTKKILCVIMAVILIAAVGCAVANSSTMKMIDAAFYMTGENNLDTHAVITFQTSDKAAAMSFNDYIGKAVGPFLEGSFNEADLELLKDTKISLDMVSKNYDGSGEFILSWAGDKGELEELLAIKYSGSDVYIGTGIIKALMPTAEQIIPGISAALTPLYEYDYIKISSSDVMDLTGGFGEEAPGEIDISDTMKKISDIVSNRLKDNAAIVLANKIDSYIKINNGAYNLKLDIEAAVEISRLILDYIIDNKDAVVAVVEEIAAVMEVDEVEFTAEDLESMINEVTAAIDGLEELFKTADGGMVKAGIEYNVSASGKGDAKRQKSDVTLSIDKEAMETLLKNSVDLSEVDDDFMAALEYIPEYFKVIIESDVKVMAKAIEMPAEKVGTIEDVMQAVMMGMMLTFDMGGFDY